VSSYFCDFRPCRKSKKEVKLNGINNHNDDDDADVALNQQFKENDSS